MTFSGQHIREPVALGGRELRPYQAAVDATIGRALPASDAPEDLFSLAAAAPNLVTNG
jgi:hypothetical protein